MNARTSKAAIAAMTQVATASAAEQLASRALRQAAEWNKNASGLRETMLLNEWRDNCRDEIRDELEDSSDRDPLLTAWATAFDGAIAIGESKVADFGAVSVEDIDGAVHIAHDQLLAMGALFRKVAQLCAERDIQLLCRFGADQVDMAANDLDCLRERAVKAGLTGGAA